MTIIDEALQTLSIFDKDINCPNIKCQVTNGGVFWTDLTKYKNWTLQQHDITKSARILDENNCRVAWGTVNGMRKVMKRLKELDEEYK